MIPVIRLHESPGIPVYELTPEAIEMGLNAALPPVYELRASIGEFGRGERSGGHTFQLSYAIVPEAGLLVEVA